MDLYLYCTKAQREFESVGNVRPSAPVRSKPGDQGVVTEIQKHREHYA